jgi:hypothetical protein
MAYTAPFSVFFYSSDSKQLRELAAAAIEQASLGQVTRHLRETILA